MASVASKVEELRQKLIREGGTLYAFDVARMLGEILYQEGPPDQPVPRTPYERMDFEREWDERVKAGRESPSYHTRSIGDPTAGSGF